MRQQGSYQSREYYERYPALKRVMDALYSDRFCREEPDLFRWVYDALVEQGDEYFHLADLPSYIDTQEEAGREFNNPSAWAHKAILNVARMGKFSSDRTIREYAKDIWGLKSVL
jgi:starch phosphorylase